MVTMPIRVWQPSGKYYCESFGKSTDAKPTALVANGSKFTEIDTARVYRFDEERNSYILWEKGGGGGGDIATDAEVAEAYSDLFSRHKT